jgi:signal transduction histidine kinase
MAFEIQNTFRAQKSRITSSLGFRLGWNLVLAGGLGAIAIMLALSATISQRFETLENASIEGHIERAGSMLERMKARVKAKSLDWSVWDATFEFVHDGNQGFIDENLSSVSLANLGVNAIAFVRFDGGFKHAEYYNSDADENDAGFAAEFLEYTTTTDFTEAAKNAPNFQTFVRQGDRLLVLSAAQVTKSDGSGIPEGILVLGEEITVAEIFEVLQIAGHYDFNLIGAPSEVAKDRSSANIARQVSDLNGAPLATIRFAVPRDLVAEGRNLLWLTSALMLVMLVLMIALVSQRLWAVVIRPVELFQGHVASIKNSGQLMDFTSDPRSDELGALYAEFNEMARELNALRSKIEAQSFAIGKTESAIGTMHNVRNGLSPVRAILSKLDGEMTLPMETEIGRAIAELSSASEPSTRQGQLLNFLQTAITHASGSLANKKILLREAICSLNGAVETIENVQSSDNKKKSFSEVCDLSSLIGNATTVARHAEGIQIDVEFASAERFQISGNRILLAQILENILTNAVQAIAATALGCGRIDIAATRIRVGADEYVRIDIKDTGDGFEAGLKQKIFERSFSTRGKTGRGVGLHWCANTANAMGGNLTIESPGPGAGATVSLILRIAEITAATGQSSPRAA